MPDILLNAVNVVNKELDLIRENIVNAGNPSYHRREVVAVTQDTCNVGGMQIGMGVRLSRIERMYSAIDEKRRLDAVTESSYYRTTVDELAKIQQELDPQDKNGKPIGLTGAVTAWQSAWGRGQDNIDKSNLLSATTGLLGEFKDRNNNLNRFADDIEIEKIRSVDEINQIADKLTMHLTELDKVSQPILGRDDSIRDTIDELLGQLANYGNVQIRTVSAMGDQAVYLNEHKLVDGCSVDHLVLRNNSSGYTNLYSQGQESLRDFSTGKLGALLEQQQLLQNKITDLDAFANQLFSSVNQIYSNGVGSDPVTSLESYLGYDAIGTNGAASTFNWIPSGENRSLTIAFFNTTNQVVRTQSIILNSADTVTTFVNKLNTIPALSASLVSDINTTGKLNLTFNSAAAINGEVSFGIYNQVEIEYLDKFESFFTTAALTTKTSNISATAPVISTAPLTSLIDTFDVADVPTLRALPLRIDGYWSLDLFETATETGGLTNGNHIEQLRIQIVNTDTIDGIAAKVNALTAVYGISMTWNAGTNAYDITTTAVTDASGNLTGGGTYAPRLSFGNFYGYPLQSTDVPPPNYSPLGDTSGILGQWQVNALITGNTSNQFNSNVFALNNTILKADDFRTGYSTDPTDSDLATDVVVMLSNLTFSGRTLQQKLIDDKHAIGQMIDINSNGLTKSEEKQTFYENRIGVVSGVDFSAVLEKLMSTMIYQKALARLESEWQDHYAEMIHILT